VLQNVEVLTSGQKTEPDPEGKPITATVVTLLVSPEQAEKVDLASNQGIVHFILRNGVDNQEFKGPPAQFGELAGLKTPDGKPIIKPAEHAPPKPYVVETVMGGTVRTDNFQ
jgi:pilus assembly protein CpaB